jgi:hypothetical protein
MWTQIILCANNYIQFAQMRIGFSKRTLRENIIRVQDNKLNTAFKLKIGQSKVMKVKGRSTLRYYVT